MTSGRSGTAWSFTGSRAADFFWVGCQKSRRVDTVAAAALPTTGTPHPGPLSARGEGGGVRRGKVGILESDRLAQAQRRRRPFFGSTPKKSPFFHAKKPKKSGSDRKKSGEGTRETTVAASRFDCGYFRATEIERGRRDSNPQPPDRQSGALTNCATAPICMSPGCHSHCVHAEHAFVGRRQGTFIREKNAFVILAHTNSSSSVGIFTRFPQRPAFSPVPCGPLRTGFGPINRARNSSSDSQRL